MPILIILPKYTGYSLNIFFSSNLVIFLNSASSAAALVFYLPCVRTHTDTEGEQRKVRVRNILKSLEKTQYLMNTLYMHTLPTAKVICRGRLAPIYCVMLLFKDLGWLHGVRLPPLGAHQDTDLQQGQQGEGRLLHPLLPRYQEIQVGENNWANESLFKVSVIAKIA